MSDELEAFLRRAAQKRQKRRTAEIVLIEPDAEPVAHQPVPERRPLTPRTPPPTSSSSPLPTTAPPQRSQADRPGTRREMPQPTSPRPSTRRHEEDAPVLAEHHLGRLLQQAQPGPGEHGLGVERTASSDSAQEILELLTSPGGARKAFILQEILAPPSHRWDP
jgi:hypothetical protein